MTEEKQQDGSSLPRTYVSSEPFSSKEDIYGMEVIEEHHCPMKKPGEPRKFSLPHKTTTLPDGSYGIRLELPGVRKDDIDVELDEDGTVIRVTGKRFSGLRPYGTLKSNQDESAQGSGSRETEVSGQEKPKIIYTWKARFKKSFTINELVVEYSAAFKLRIILKKRPRPPQDCDADAKSAPF